MKNPYTDPQGVISDITPLVPVLYQALEEGTTQAREYFDSLDRPTDASLYPCLVRYHAKQRLRNQRWSALCDVDDLANNGLALTFDRYRIRILKSSHGDIPAPGTSRTRQRFWAQDWTQEAFPFREDEALELQDIIINLLIIWDVGPTHNLNLQIACPKSGDIMPESVEVYWKQPLPHVAETVTYAQSSPEDEDDFEDLNITLPEQETRIRRQG